MSYSLERHNNFVIYKDTIENQEIKLEAKDVIGLTQVKFPKPLADKKVFYNTVNNPDTGKPLSQIVKNKNAKTASIIISDITRGVPTMEVASHIIDALLEGGIKLSNIVFIVALGVHRPATKKEMKDFIGDEYSRVKIINHDAYDEQELVELGKTSQGTILKVNKTAYESDVKIIVGKVELHEFAGFSGGRKSVLPGISAESSIRVNHRPDAIFAKNAEPGVLKDNPIHLDMLESANMLGVDFCVNFITDDAGRTIGIFSGELESSHLLAADYVKSFSNILLSEKPDIIVTTCGYPLNCEFYQALKALIAFTKILDPDLSIVLYAECPEGVNSPDMMRPFELFDSLDEIDNYVMNNYKIQMDHTLPLTKILRKKSSIFVYAPGVLDEEIRTLWLEPCNSLSNAINTAIIKSKKENPRILFFPQPQKALISHKW